MHFRPIVYVADAGSVAKGNFHWVCSEDLDRSSTNLGELASSVASHLKADRWVALGYESPLFAPCGEEAIQLGKARNGEAEEATGPRPFNAGGGASILATGIQSLAWVLRQIRKEAACALATTDWEEFQRGGAKLLVWEAFVSGSEKAVIRGSGMNRSEGHAADARLAIEAFNKRIEGRPPTTRIPCAAAFSLAGAAILFADLSKNMELLRQPCIVLRPVFSPQEAAKRLLEYNQLKSGKRHSKRRAREAQLEKEIQKRLKTQKYGS